MGRVTCQVPKKFRADDGSMYLPLDSYSTEHGNRQSFRTLKSYEGRTLTYFSETAKEGRAMLRLSSASRSINRLHFSPQQNRCFSTGPRALKRPTRPEPIGEVVAHFPQEHKVERIRESKERYAARWKKYIKDLGSVATPKTLAGRDFGSKVRRHPRARRDDRMEQG